jgi:uncharacterized protein YndB with AHSA1/START domain
MTSAASAPAARAVADIGQGTIIAAVVVDAPIERVFAALTTPEELLRWWGSSDTYRSTEWTADLRVGGRWRAAGRSVDGQPYVVEGEFLEIEPPRKLVQSWKPSWDAGHETKLTYRLDPIAQGTRVTVRHEGFAGRGDSCQAHTAGWERVLQWLQAHVAPRRDPAAPRQYFLLRLLPPRPTFALDMTPAERSVMQEHVAYWQGLVAQGNVIAFGPVADPKGGWGVGLIEVDDAAAAAALQSNDPAIRGGIGCTYEALPMPRVLMRGGM